MKKIRSFFWPVVILCVGCVSANAQWQTPNYSVPIGRGSGTGFKSTGPSSTSGQPLISQGASSDPVFGTAPVSGGGTGATSFTSNLPLIGNGTGAVAQGTRSGNTTSFATTSGSLTSGNCVSIDASGNLVAAAGACGTSGFPVTVQTGSYTIQTSDCNSLIAFTGAFGTVTLPAAAGFPSSCMIIIKNNNTTRAQKLASFPATLASGCGGACLWPTQSITMGIVSGAWSVVTAPGRWKLTSSLTIYADTTGSNNNDCLTTGSSGACATIMGAYRILHDQIDAGSGPPTLTIQAASGTYSEQLQFYGQLTGNHVFVLNCGGGTISVGNNQIAISARDFAAVQVYSCTVTGSSGARGFNSDQYAIIDIQSSNVCSTLTTGRCISATNYGIININDVLTISGNTSFPLFSSTKGNINMFANVDIPTARAFDVTCRADMSSVIYVQGGSFTGAGVAGTTTSTGRYLSATLANINTAGGGANFCPGNVAGSNNCTTSASSLGACGMYN